MDIPDFVKAALEQYLDDEGNYGRTIVNLLRANERSAAGWLETHNIQWGVIVEVMRGR